MKSYELAQVLQELEDEINVSSNLTKQKLIEPLDISNPSNTIAVQHADEHNAMCNYIVCSYIAAKYKKLADVGKKELDYTVEKGGGIAEGIASTTQLKIQNNVLTFEKKQNKDGTTTLLTDVLNNLARAGVDKTVVDKAVKDAAKPKRGNTYYVVRATD